MFFRITLRGYFDLLELTRGLGGAYHDKWLVTNIDEEACPTLWTSKHTHWNDVCHRDRKSTTSFCLLGWKLVLGENTPRWSPRGKHPEKVDVSVPMYREYFCYIMEKVKNSQSKTIDREQRHWLSDPLWKKYFLTIAGVPPEWTRGSTSPNCTQFVVRLLALTSMRMPWWSEDSIENLVVLLESVKGPK